MSLSSNMSRRLCACLLNVSEARNYSKIQNIAKAALQVNTSEKGIQAAVLNIFQDQDYNRSVLTIVGSVGEIGASIVSACTEAFSCIDLRDHEGGHPRLGAVDLIPIHPISATVSLQDCATVAKDVSSTLSQSVPGSSFFLAGAAHPGGLGLVARRKQVLWFKGQHGSSYQGIQHDVGQPPSPRYGLTGVAAIPYVTNCNVTIDSDDLDLGRRIARALRATTPGGFLGVQAMAFPHAGKVEIACNVQGVILNEEMDEDGDNKTKKSEHEGIEHGDIKTKNSNDAKEAGDNITNREDANPNKYLVRTCGDCFHVPSYHIEDRVRSMAQEVGVSVVDSALIVGFEPAECERLAIHALDSGIGEFWKTRTKLTM